MHGSGGEMFSELNGDDHDLPPGAAMSRECCVGQGLKSTLLSAGTLFGHTLNMDCIMDYSRVVFS